jgi:prepilin-type N-terminal cleavage/methylation domain-containing protein/prepilin-type processing-associated H-X9-DG protein
MKIMSGKQRSGFTLIELLVVISIIALLLAIIMPALSKARQSAQTVACGSQMRQWAFATVMYSENNDGSIPYFADAHPQDPDVKWWLQSLADYLDRTGETEEDGQFHSKADVFESDVRRCAAAQPRLAQQGGYAEYDCYVGVNNGIGNSKDAPLQAPFFYRYIAGTTSPPLQLMSIQRPSEAMGFLDVIHHHVYSPAEDGGKTPYDYTFDLDYDGDGQPDTSKKVFAYGRPRVPYNYARPKVHNNGCNVGLLDGHVEWIPYRKLWEVDSSGEVQHPYWDIRR